MAGLSWFAKRNGRVAWCSRIVFLMLLCSSARYAVAQSIKLSGRTMGPIEYRVVVGEETSRALSREKARQRVDEELQKVNQLMLSSSVVVAVEETVVAVEEEVVE